MFSTMKLNQIIQELSSHICNQEWISEDAKIEINAVVSHLLQSPSIQVPFLTNAILKEYRSFIKCRLLVDDHDFTSNKTKSTHRIQELDKAFQTSFNFIFKDLPYPPLDSHNFTFIDLFAGIGGFRIAFQRVGGKCVFTSEWDKFAKQTYAANFGEYPYGDIRKINKNEIPDHDVLCAGFPCQPFSLAGVSKKQSLGRKHGFEDETQGTLFFEIKEIIRIKRPKAFMLENVKNLVSHDKGKTFEIIRHALEEQLGYVIQWKIIDGGNWVPQHRERIFIVGYDPQQININKQEIVIPDRPNKHYIYPELKSILQEEVEGYTIGPGTWDTLKRHKAYHSDIGNGFGYSLHNFPIENGTVTRTISARYHKDGAEVLVNQENKRPRRLTIREGLQLQGYDADKFIFPVSNTQAYKQIGNSVVVPAIYECATEISKVIKRKNDFIAAL